VKKALLWVGTTILPGIVTIVLGDINLVSKIILPIFSFVDRILGKRAETKN